MGRDALGMYPRIFLPLRLVSSSISALGMLRWSSSSTWARTLARPRDMVSGLVRDGLVR